MDKKVFIDLKNVFNATNYDICQEPQLISLNLNTMESEQQYLGESKVI